MSKRHLQKNFAKAKVLLYVIIFLRIYKTLLQFFKKTIKELLYKYVQKLDYIFFPANIIERLCVYIRCYCFGSLKQSTTLYWKLPLRLLLSACFAFCFFCRIITLNNTYMNLDRYFRHFDCLIFEITQYSTDLLGSISVL